MFGVHLLLIIMQSRFFLISAIDNILHEKLMDACVVVKFRVESSDELAALLCRNNMSVEFGKDLDIVACGSDVWRTDEGHGNLADAFHCVDSAETAELSAIGVALHGDVHCPEMLMVKHDQSGACAEDGQTVEDCVTDWCEKTFVTDDAHHGSALASGDYQPVFRLLPVIDVPDKEGFHTNALQHFAVFGKCSL